MKKLFIIVAAVLMVPSLASAQYVVAGPAAAPAPAPAPAWRCDGVCPTSYFQVSVDLEGSSDMAGGLLKMGYGWGTTAMSNMVSLIIGSHSLNSDDVATFPDEDLHLGIAYDVFKPLHWSPWFRIGLTAGLAGGLGMYSAYLSDGYTEEDASGFFASGKVGLFMSWLPGPLASFNWRRGEWEYLPNYFELFAKADYNMMADAIGGMDNSTYSNLFVGINLGWWIIFW